MPNTSSNYQAVISSGGAVIAHQFPPTNYPTDVDPVTRVTECDYGTECPCIGITPGSGSTGGGSTITISASEATLASAGIVKTCNASTGQATSTTVALVPTQYFVQSEITRLEGLISSASSTTVISSSIVSSSTIVSNDAATLESAGIVTTCNTSNAQVTSETVAVVPTQYYVQSELGRLEELISGNSGGSQIVTSQAAWVPLTNLGDSTTVTLEAGQKYKLRTSIGSQTITAVTSGSDVIGSDTTLLFGVSSLENLTISYPLILKDELIPGLNICTVKFVDTRAYLFVDLCITDYTVTITTDITGDITTGSIHYGLTSAPMEDINFAPAINGSACLLNGAIVRTDKTLIGNGMNNTIISGLMGCASGASCTMNSLTLQSVDILEGSGTIIMSAAEVQNVNNSGTMKLVGSENVINGSLCSPGDLQVENGAVVCGTGTVDMCNKQVTWLGVASCSGLTFMRGSSTKGGLGFFKNMGAASAVFTNCTFTNNSATSACVMEADYGGHLVFSNCTFSGNKGSKGLVMAVNEGTILMASCYIGSNTISVGGVFTGGGHDYKITFEDCHLNGGVSLPGTAGIATFIGSNYFIGGQVKEATSSYIRLSAGGILDIRDNTNATPLSAGSGIVIGSASGNTWVEGGTFSVIISGGETVSISGSGTTLNSAGVLA